MGYFSFPHTRSYDSDLGWLIKNVSSYNETIAALNEWIATNTPRIDDLEAFKAAMESGELPEEVQAGINTWMRENAISLIGELIKPITFGLTNAGYFAAFVPDSWDGLTFGTIQTGELYGHLTLSYD